MSPKTLAGAAVLAALLIMPFAATASASTPSVTFTGTPLLNLGTLSCPSTPSVSQVTLSGGSVVTFINHTGRDATLRVGGKQLAVADQASRSVTFKDGTYTAEMDPDCALNVASHGQVAIDVKPATVTAAPTPTAAPTVTTHQATSTGHIKTVAVAPAAKPAIATGGGVKAATTAQPTAAAGVQPQTIGAIPTTPTNNRPLIEMILAAVILLSGVIIAQLLSLRRRLHRVGHGGNGGGSHGARDVPQGQAAQIFNLAQRIKQREMERNRHSG